MHEYLLFSQIAPARHSQVMNILTGITGAPPYQYQEQHVLLAPLPGAAQVTNAQKKKAQPTPAVSQQRWMHNLSRSVQITDGSTEATSSWTIKIDQSPDPAVKDLVAREASEETVEDAKVFEKAEAYRLKGTYVNIGHRFGRLALYFTQPQKLHANLIQSTATSSSASIASSCTQRRLQPRTSCSKVRHLAFQICRFSTPAARTWSKHASELKTGAMLSSPSKPRRNSKSSSAIWRDV